MSNDGTGLRECPFCGTTDVEVYPADREQSRWNVCCGNPGCVARGDNDYTTLSDAKAAWNRRALSAVAPPPVLPVDLAAWHPMETAPRDGTLLRLLVAFTEHATEDSVAPMPTIGANSFDHSGDDEWRFAGWSWEQDCFTQGEGTPVGWLPMLAASPAAPAQPEGGGAVSSYLVVNEHGDVVGYSLPQFKDDVTLREWERLVPQYTRPAPAQQAGMDERLAFERVYLQKAGRYAARNEVGDYVLPAIQDAWCGWKERAALASNAAASAADAQEGK